MGDKLKHDPQIVAGALRPRVFELPAQCMSRQAGMKSVCLKELQRGAQIVRGFGTRFDVFLSRAHERAGPQQDALHERISFISSAGVDGWQRPWSNSRCAA